MAHVAGRLPQGPWQRGVWGSLLSPRAAAAGGPSPPSWKGYCCCWCPPPYLEGLQLLVPPPHLPGRA